MACIAAVACIMLPVLGSCKKTETNPEALKSKLSEYNIYTGHPSGLVPNGNYTLYELSSQLFTDYAEKQRLIKLPAGATLKVTGDGLPEFPEGTLIVKTFYYFKDKRHPAGGNKLVETRILALINGQWVAGTYLWNEAQTDASLLSGSLNKTINWIDESGSPRVISYHIPDKLECKACHSLSNRITPIGPKIRNLNINVSRNNATVNQLIHLHNQGVLDSVTPGSFSTLPDYKDGSKTIEERGRAYLEINCAHCHNANGFASRLRFRMSFETGLRESKIPEGKAAIKNKMEKGRMPKLGTTIIDKERLELIKKFIGTL